VTSYLSMCVVMTMASVCRNDTSLMSASVKVRGMWDHLVHHMIDLAIVLSSLPFVLEM
jgi:hypothetical protein